MICLLAGFVLSAVSLDMTTIAAIQGDGWAVIAGDSQSSDGDGFAINIPTGKIFKNNELIIAGAGQVRGINLLEHGWEAPAVKLKNIDKYVTSILVPSIRKCFSMADYEYKRDGESVEMTTSLSYVSSIKSIELNPTTLGNEARTISMSQGQASGLLLVRWKPLTLVV